MNFFYFVIKYIFLSKWKILPPKRNKFVLVDGHYNPFLKYINKKKITILYRRGEEINFFVLFKCILKLKFSSLDYFVEFIKLVSPNLILTAFDYHSIFYKLSRETGIKTLMLQKGKRSKIDIKKLLQFNKDFKKKNRNVFFVDYILVYNKAVINFYSNYISGKYYEIGSFENNFQKIKNKKKKEILFISNYNLTNDDKLSPKCENEDNLALEIYQLAQKNNLKFNILPRNRLNREVFKKEYFFYKKKLNSNFRFIDPKRISAYEVVNNYEYIFSSYSTMAIEALAKNSRVGFIFWKSLKNPIYDYWFASFENFKKKGPFWTNINELNEIEIKRVFNFVVKSTKYEWEKKSSNYKNLLMKYDYDNEIFKKILKNDKNN